jgi:hypothetical protein
MAVTAKTIAASGADYTSISAWEAAANRASDANIWKGTCTDNTDHSAAVTFASGGTPSATSYLWLTSDAYCPSHSASNRGGQYTGGNAQMYWITDNWCRIEKLDLSGTDIAGTDRLIFVENAANVLISRCLIWNADPTVNGGIGIHADDTAVTVSIDNCAIYGWGKGGVSGNDFSFGKTQNWRIDHCTIVDNGNSGATGDGNIYMVVWGGPTYNIPLYNTIVVDGAGGDDEINSPNAGGTGNLSGSHNAYTSSAEIDAVYTNTTTNWQSATSGGVTGTKASGAWICYVNYDVGNNPTAMDVTLVAGAGNLAVGNGTDRQGSEPDARQDFSLDIGGNVRSALTVDIGCSQISVDAAGGSLLLMLQQSGI